MDLPIILLGVFFIVAMGALYLAFTSDTF